MGKLNLPGRSRESGCQSDQGNSSPTRSPPGGSNPRPAAPGTRRDSRSRPNRETGIPCFPPVSRSGRDRESGTPGQAGNRPGPQWEMGLGDFPAGLLPVASV
jgi:hypothetical protein